VTKVVGDIAFFVRRIPNAHQHVVKFAVTVNSPAIFRIGYVVYFRSSFKLGSGHPEVLNVFYHLPNIYINV
jgi:hypothetical protein